MADIRHIAGAVLLVGTNFALAPASAETLEQLDALAEASASEESGIGLAQEQAQRGDFLEAIATLERVLALHPKSQVARLLHAVYLCRIDDTAGGMTELGKLKEKNFSDELWAQANAICTGAGGQ